jgi:hypothetical protein
MPTTNASDGDPSMLTANVDTPQERPQGRPGRAMLTDAPLVINGVLGMTRLAVGRLLRGTPMQQPRVPVIVPDHNDLNSGGWAA